MNRTKDTFSGFLSDQKQLDQESDLIPLIIHYLKAQLGDTTVSALEHLFQPACYAELNLSGNEAEFKHLLLAISKEQINHKKPLFLISNYTLFPLIDKAGRVNYVFGFTPSAEIDHRRLSGLCTEIQTIWQLVEAFHQGPAQTRVSSDHVLDGLKHPFRVALHGAEQRQDDGRRLTPGQRLNES